MTKQSFGSIIVAMDFLKPFVFILFVSTVCLSPIHTHADEVQLGQPFNSPDGTFTAKLNDGGDDPNADEAILVIDNRTGKEFPPQPTLTPVLLIKWMSDSKTFIRVVHIASGNEASVAHFQGDKWVYYNATPTFGDAYEVIRQSFSGHGIQLSYKISMKSTATHDGKCYIQSFSVNTSTGKRSQKKLTSISANTYGRLHLAGLDDN